MKLSQRLKTGWTRSIQVSPFASRVTLTFFTNLALAGLSLFSGIVVARLLGPTGRGELAAIQTWSMFFASLAMLGLPEALVYFTARFPTAAGRYLSTATLSSLLIGIPIGILGFILLPVLLNAQSSEIISYARQYLLLILIYAVTGMMTQALRGRNDIATWNVVRLLPSIAWVFILIITFFFLRPEPGPLSTQYLIALGLLTIPISLIVLRRIPGPYQPDRSSLKPMFTYALPSFLGSLPGTLNLRLDQMLMAALLNSKLLGLYVVAVGWSSAAGPLINALSSIIVPHVAEASENEVQISRLSQSLRIGSFFSILLVIIMFLITPFVLPWLFGKDFSSVVPAAMILCVAAGFAGMNQLLESGALGIGEPRFVLYAEGIGLGVTIILLSLLLKPYQLMGAAVASLTSYLVIMILLTGFLSRKTKLRFWKLILLHKSDLQFLIFRLKNLNK